MQDKKSHGIERLILMLSVGADTITLIMFVVAVL